MPAKVWNHGFVNREDVGPCWQEPGSTLVEVVEDRADLNCNKRMIMYIQISRIGYLCELVLYVHLRIVNKMEVLHDGLKGVSPDGVGDEAVVAVPHASMHLIIYNNNNNNNNK